MSGYRFKVGQTVSYIPHFGAGAAKSTYKIVQLLPPEAATSNIGSKVPTRLMNG